jgi:hypothetical protein
MTTLPTAIERRPSSMFAWSAASRLAVVSVVAALLWLAVAWALGVFG